MVQLSRNAQVLRFLLEAAPGIGHTKLAKFAYLADLEARKYLGRPISSFRYVVNRHGPFDARGFFATCEELKTLGFVTEREVYVGPYRGYEFHPTPMAPEYGFSLAETEVLSYVARTYMALTAKDLCDDVVYETEPMKKKNLKTGDRLPMDIVNRKRSDDLEFDLDRMLAGEASAKAGRVKPVGEALSELRARHC